MASLIWILIENDPLSVIHFIGMQILPKCEVKLANAVALL